MIRYKPPGDTRSFGDQLEALCEAKGLLKQQVAEKAEITPAQLSHYIKFGTSLRMMERISKAVGIDPGYFDAYVAEDSSRLISEHKELLDFLRKVRATSGIKRQALLKKLP